MNTVSINVTPRTELGKKATKAVRREGRIPCVMYGGSDPVHFTTVHNDVKSLVYTPDFKVAEITVDGTTHKCIIKDITFHPVTEIIEHIDFLRLIDGTPVKIELPVRFRGSSPGVRVGGKLIQSMRRIKVKALPENLVDELVLDISNLELGHAIRVRDIDVVEGIEVMSPGPTPVASVEVPRALRSATAAAETVEE